jgi:metal-responsive CopG/Arc/MetJ family transcriptional regulator
MTTQMIIRIEAELKNEVARCAKKEGKKLSELVRELLADYVKEKDVGAHIDDLWDRIGNRLVLNNVSESDVDEAIQHVRRNSA